MSLAMDETRQAKCYQCGKYRPLGGFWHLHSNESDYEWHLCSLSCLTERVWELREQEPKMSKSKQEAQ